MKKSVNQLAKEIFDKIFNYNKQMREAEEKQTPFSTIHTNTSHFAYKVCYN
jgi:hypothetical protein